MQIQNPRPLLLRHLHSRIRPRLQRIHNTPITSKPAPRQTRHQNRLRTQRPDLPNHTRQIHSHRFGRSDLLVVVPELERREGSPALGYLGFDRGDCGGGEGDEDCVGVCGGAGGRGGIPDISHQPSATKLPVVAPFRAVLIHGVLASSADGVPFMGEPQNPFPQPPLLSEVLYVVRGKSGMWKFGGTLLTRSLSYYLRLAQRT